MIGENWRTGLLSELPIVQAPMAGGPSTAALTAAVANAGGLGFVAGGYLSAGDLHDALVAARVLTGAALGVNLFVPSDRGDRAQVEAYAEVLRSEADRLGVGLGEPRWDDDAYDAKLEVVQSDQVHLVSFTFGCPASEIVDRLHRVGTQVAVTVTSVREAQLAVGTGADLLVVQGAEAGGHQGSFVDLTAKHRPLLSILAEIRASTSVPLIATGGIMSGRDAAAALRAGAIAVQIGTALLCTPEAGTSSPHREALLDERYPETIITRAYSGRFARGLKNELIDSGISVCRPCPVVVPHRRGALQATVASERSSSSVWSLSTAPRDTGSGRVGVSDGGLFVRGDGRQIAPYARCEPRVLGR